MIISIDGNIGAGKSDLLEYLKRIVPDDASVDFFPEPVDEWHELFVKYIKNKKQYALPFTLEVLRQFGRIPRSRATHQIVERSPLATSHVFNTILKNDDVLVPSDDTLIDSYITEYGWVPDVILFLDVDSSTCTDRVESRAREGEEAIGYEHLRAVEFYYDKLLASDHVKNIRIVRCKQAASETKDAFHARIGILVNDTLARSSPDHDVQKHRRHQNM